MLDSFAFYVLIVLFLFFIFLLQKNVLGLLGLRRVFGFRRFFFRVNKVYFWKYFQIGNTKIFLPKKVRS